MFFFMWWQVDKVSPIKLFDENKSLAGLNLRHLLFQHGGAEFVRGALQKVFQLWQDGKVKPLVDSTWALEDVPEAMQVMHDRKNIGKIVLDPSLEPKPKPATPAKGKTGKDKKQNSEEKKDAKEEKTEEKASEEKKVVENGDKEEAVNNGNAEEEAKEKESS